MSLKVKNNTTINALMFLIVSLLAPSYAWSSCFEELSRIVAGSNFKGMYPRGSQSVELVLDSIEGGIITAKVRYVSAGSRSPQGFQGDQGVGWVKYNEPTGELFEIDVADEAVRRLGVQEKYIVAYNECKKKSLTIIAAPSEIVFKQMTIKTSQKRSYFYLEPEEGALIKNLFLINGDKVQAFNSQNEFTKVRYIRKNGEAVDGWIKSSDLSF
ncbi:MAG TPA: hypothetical protein PK129_17195 [Cellvibrionaceae bacterium]|nr:hypothetical protein [Cellvibrionaceae bacterium]